VSADTRSAILKARALLEKSLGESNAQKTLSVRRLFSKLANVTDGTQLASEVLDLDRVLSDIFDSVPPLEPGEPLDVVIGAARTRLLSASYSAYPPALEVVSYAVPLVAVLSPQRVAEFIATAQGNGLAFSPVYYPAQVVTRLQSLLGGYSENVRYQLAVDLFDQLHTFPVPRWVEKVVPRPQYTMTGRVLREPADVYNAQVGTLLSALADGRVRASVDYQVADRLRREMIPPNQRGRLVAAAASNRLLMNSRAALAARTDLSAAERPASLLVPLLEGVLSRYATDDESVLRRRLPTEPAGFASLVP